MESEEPGVSIDRSEGIVVSSPHASALRCAWVGNGGARSRVRDAQQMPSGSRRLVACGFQGAARAAFTSYARLVRRTSNG